MDTVLDLRRDYDLVETRVRRVVKDEDNCKYLAVVFKNKYDEFCWFYQDCSQPYAFHDIATGFENEENAKEDLADTLGIDKSRLD
jgi:hypothetical protein